MTRKFTLLIMMFFIGVSTLMAQATLSGNVKDDSGEPVILGTVALYKGGDLISGKETDFDGNYHFSNLDPGTYDVEFSYVGYPTLKIEGVIVNGGKSNKLDAELQAGVDLTLVTVIEYRKPLIETDNVTSGGIVTSEEIGRLPVKDIGSIASSTAGVATSNDGSGDINVRGGRKENTSIIIDGIRVSGNMIPQSEIEQLQVITGGIGAEYGDVTGGIISITTKGPSRNYSGGIELETSEFLDAFGYNLLSANVSGPIMRKKADEHGNRSTLVGFRLSGQYRTIRDPRPSAKGVYSLKEDRLASLQATPMLRIDGANYNAAEYLRSDDVELLDAQPNETQTTLDIVGKIDARLSDAIDMTLSGTFNSDDDQFTPGGRSQTDEHWRLFNNHNNPTQIDTRYRGNFRFRHKIGGTPKISSEDDADTKAKKSLIENVQYILQAGFERGLTDLGDKRHGENVFDYGYIGTFKEENVERFDYVGPDDDLAGKGIPVICPQGTPWAGEICYRVHMNTEQVFAGYTPGSQNTTLANYNQFIDQEDINSFLYTNGLDVVNRSEVFGLHKNIGQVYNLYRKRDNETYTFNVSSSFDIVPGESKDSRHSVKLGFNYEQRINRGYDLNPRKLWTMANAEANVNILGNGLDYSNSTGTALDGTPIYGFKSINQPNSKFYQEVRTALGVPLNQWVNVNDIDPSKLDLSMFSAGEVNAQNILDYWGYDHTGEKLGPNVTFEDFFKGTDADGRKTFEVAAQKPIYWSAYLQDKFSYKDIIFRMGVRVDRFDANTKVMKDKYSLYEVYGFDDFNNQIKAGELETPGFVDGEANDYLVYTTARGGGEIAAFRNGSTWYYPDGTEAVRPQDIFGEGLAFPRLVNPDRSISSDDFEVSKSFTDYVPQLNFAPRLGFSFPISQESGKEAGFFAHYDVLVQRPTVGNRATALDYYYFVDRTPLNNPNLKPEKTIDYEVGFKQALSTASAITVQAYYREMRDMIQRTTLSFTDPVPEYETLDNIDFGTVKGFTFTYDLRRTKNLLFNASYTLQFADGTGSDTDSQRGLTARGNVRVLFPLNFDERHKFNVVMDYRYPSGKKYHGPKWWGVNVFESMGINIQASAVSGRPYTSKSQPSELGGDGTVGALNGARLPWNYTVNAQIDRDITLKKGRKASKDVRGTNGLHMNVYLRVQNLLDTRNVIDVYEASGSADNDGYLESVRGQSRLNTIQNTGADVQLFQTSYQWRLLNPAFYSLPRRIYIGMRFNF